MSQTLVLNCKTLELHILVSRWLDMASIIRHDVLNKVHIVFYVVWSSILPVFVFLLSQQFKSGDFVFMQDSAPCSTHRAKATQGDL